MNNPSPLIGGLVPALLAGPNYAVLQPLVTQFKQQLIERYASHPDLLTAFTQLEKQPDRQGRQQLFQEEAETVKADKDLILLKIIQQMVAALPPTPPTVTITASGGSAVAYGQGSTAVGARGVNVGGTVHGPIVTGDVHGQTIGIGGAVTQTLGSDPLTLTQAFERITQAVAKSQASPVSQQIGQQAVTTIRQEAEKGEQADESTTEQWLDLLLKTLPDIAEVVLDTLLHPVKGLSTVVRKVALKARAGRKPEKPHGS
jgi:hypothetical protein